MKKSVFLAASLLAGGIAASPLYPVRAQEAPAQSQPQYSSLAAARAAGEKLFAERKYKEARAAFTAALALAKSSAEKADVLTEIARTHEKEVIVQEIRTGKSAVRRQTSTDYPAARLRYEEIEKLEDLAAERKHEARLAIANTFVLEGSLKAARDEYTKVIGTEGASPAVRAVAYTARAGTYLKGLFVSSQDFTTAYTDAETAVRLTPVPDPVRGEALLVMADLNARANKVAGALDNLASVVALPKATDDQKSRALMRTGNYHMRAKAPERARAAWAQIPALAGANPDDKMQAHQGLAQIYVEEKKIEQAVAELDKAAQLPGLTVFQRAELFENMGDVQMNGGQFAAARAAYARILALTDAGPLRHKEAILKTGQSYLQEKNPTAARTEWEKLVARNNPDAGDALRYIGVSYFNEMKFAEARAAFERWIALPVAMYWKEDAHLLLAQVHEREMNWAGAREAFQKLIGDPNVRASRRIRAVLGVVRTHESEKNAAAAQQAFELLPAAFQSMGQLSPAETTEVAQWRAALTKQLSERAATLGKDKATLPQAVALYRAVEKIYIPDSDKLETILALADLFFSHAMTEEAKAEYGKVSSSPRASNTQLNRAKARLKEIEDKAIAAGSN